MNNIEKLAERDEPIAYEVTYDNKTVVLVWEENELDPDNVEVWGNYVMEPLYKKAKAYAQQSSEPVAELATNPVFIYNHYTATLLIKDDAHPKTVGLVKGAKLFTHPPASVPLEKYNKLFDLLLKVSMLAHSELPLELVREIQNVVDVERHGAIAEAGDKS